MVRLFFIAAAPAIVADDVILSPGVRERLALPGAPNREKVYQALFQHTDSKPIRVRKAGASDVPLAASRAGTSPVFAVEGASACRTGAGPAAERRAGARRATLNPITFDYKSVRLTVQGYSDRIASARFVAKGIPAENIAAVGRGTTTRPTGA